MKYQFDEFELDDQTLELRQNGSIVRIEPQVFELLVLLIANSDRVVTKNEIHDDIWQGRIVSDASLNTSISAARIAIGDSGKQQRLIKTIHGRGFRFVGKTTRMQNKNALPEKDALGITTYSRKLPVVFTTILLVVFVGAGLSTQ